LFSYLSVVFDFYIGCKKGINGCAGFYYTQPKIMFPHQNL
jgi:hypothetical protein